jgi:hypothetical protein
MTENGRAHHSTQPLIDIVASGQHHFVRTQLRSEVGLKDVSSYNRDVYLDPKGTKYRYGRKADHAAPHHQDLATGLGRLSEYHVDATRERFEQNGGLVRKGHWNGVKLRIVADELLGPATGGCTGRRIQVSVVAQKGLPAEARITRLAAKHGARRLSA